MTQLKQLLAPAKINLALHITSQRIDKKHEIDTLVAFSQFGDYVSGQIALSDSFKVTGPYASALNNDNAPNLMTRARDLLRGKFTPKQCPPVALCLEKNMPVASGIGGGSSDGAACLKLLNRMWDLNLSEQQLAGLSLVLGADFPMCIYSKPLIARGIGEKVTLCALPSPLHLVLVNAGVAVSTKDIFCSLKQKNNSPLPVLPKFTHLLEFVTWLKATRNDLQPPALIHCHPIGETIQALLDHNALFSRMSGSGATCFGIFKTQAQAQLACRSIRLSHPHWFVTSTRKI